MTNRSEYLPFGRPNFSQDEIEAITRVMHSGWIGMGPETELFEKELAEFLAAPRVVTVNSCTAALFLSLLVNGIGPGDEVICPSFTWCSTANVALYLGAKPVFADIDPHSFCVTAEHIADKLTSRTRAVIVVHMGGLAADVQAIRTSLPDDVALIEDAAHALGARYRDGSTVGSSGNLTCLSFYANKNLSTGEGGAIALCDDELGERFASLRQHGLSANAWKRFSHPTDCFDRGISELGYKMNYTDLQACIGRVQLRRQAEFRETRLAIASRYCSLLESLAPECSIQSDILHPNHSRHLFQILLPQQGARIARDELVIRLRERNVGAAIHYPALHEMPLYRDPDRDPLPNTESICRRIVTLPISASMNVDDAQFVIDQMAALI